MTKVQKIEDALKQINETVFQELCDAYLLRTQEDIRSFGRTGSQRGKQKTTRGTPDSYFLLSNGSYGFVEVTTNISNKNKLAEDIAACFDSKKAKIPIQKIEKVFLCFNFDIDQSKEIELSNLAQSFNENVSVEFFGLGRLAMELMFSHRDLVRDYLGLSFDTGQIVSVKRFIEEYDKKSRGIATPLDNMFLFREEEKKELNNALSKNDWVILTGKAGVGKTKLAIEGLNDFCEKNPSYSGFCISYKQTGLLEDLDQYFNSEKNFILLVDDANRIDTFRQIIGFYQSKQKGSLKVLITVRDYAIEQIKTLTQDFTPKVIPLEKFRDEEIIKLIEREPFGILNYDYQKEILKISEGNPRLAIMTARLALEKQRIDVLHDVSDLFEAYFSNFLKDEEDVLYDNHYLKSLGLIAFFHIIPYSDRTITEQILSKFDLEYKVFIEVIDKLEKIEIVELRYGSVKISEQNLAIFFFYKAFVQNELLSFETLLNNYFFGNEYRFKECVISANNSFGANRVMDKLLPDLRRFLSKIESSKAESYKFLEIFWFYLKTETLSFIYNEIKDLPIKKTEEYDVSYEINQFAYGRDINLQLLQFFYHYPDSSLKEALDLSFEYARRKPETLSELIYSIKSTLTFDYKDNESAYFRQNTLFEILIEGMEQEDLIIVTSFFELSKTFLKSKFQHTEGGRNNTFRTYSYSLKPNKFILKFRSDIWEVIERYFMIYPEKSLALLKSYAQVSGVFLEKEILEEDASFICNIISKHLNPNIFDHCLYVHNQKDFFKRNSIDSELESIARKFITKTYKIYLRMDWRRLRAVPRFRYKSGYKKYDLIKEREIRQSFLFQNLSEFREFYGEMILIQNTFPNESFNHSFDVLIEENLSKDFDLGCDMLIEIINNGNPTTLMPYYSLSRHLDTNEKAQNIWQIINNRPFDKQNEWKSAFFVRLNEQLINKSYIESLINFIVNLRGKLSIHFGFWKKYLLVDSNLFLKLLDVIYQKNIKESETQILISDDLYSQFFPFIKKDLELVKKSFIQQEKLDSHFDFDRIGFLNILQEDKRFLIESLKYMLENQNDSFFNKNKKWNRIWKVKDIESILGETMNFLAENVFYFGFQKHLCNCFFEELKNDELERAKNFLRSYLSDNFSNSERVNIIVDISRTSIKIVFESVLLTFLSLTQDVKVFSEIWWCGNGSVRGGNTTFGDVEAANWSEIRRIVNKSSAGISLLPIKEYVIGRITDAKIMADEERKRRFMSVSNFF